MRAFAAACLFLSAAAGCAGRNSSAPGPDPQFAPEAEALEKLHQGCPLPSSTCVIGLSCCRTLWKARLYVTLIDLAEDEAHRRHVLMFATSRLRAHDAAERVQAAKLFAMVSGDSEFLSRWVADEVRAAVAGIEGVNLSNVLAAARFSNGTLERVTSRSVDADGVIHTDRRETLRYAGCVSVVIRRSPSAPGVLDRIRRLAAIRAGIDPESVTVVEVPR